MPLFHIHGLVAALLASLGAGGLGRLHAGLSPAARSSTGSSELEPTWYTAVPTMHQAVLDRARRDRGSRSPGTGCASSARRRRRCPSPVLERLEEVFGVPVIEAYGMTEAAHQMASNPLPPGARKPGSVGPAAGPEIAILDADGRAARRRASSARSRSAARTSSPATRRNPEANAAAFTDGWFRTGDEGSLDEDGYLTLAGGSRSSSTAAARRSRRSRSTKRCSRHPAVAQAVTFAMPHDRLGEEVAAAVVLRAGDDGDRARAAGLRRPDARAVQGAAPDRHRRRDPEGADGQGAAHRARRAARPRRHGASAAARPAAQRLPRAATRRDLGATSSRAGRRLTTTSSRSAETRSSAPRRSPGFASSSGDPTSRSSRSSGRRPSPG